MPSKKISPEYLAGYVDADGCILIRKSLPRGTNKTPCYDLALEVGSSYLPVLKDIQTTYGGNIYKNGTPKFPHRQMYRWRLRADKAQPVLEAIYPLLRQKRAQAWVALEYLAQRTKWNGAWGGISATELALREGFYLILRDLKNAYG